MKVSHQVKVNSQSGQVGFFVALLMAGLLVTAASLAVNSTESTRRTASETQGAQNLNLGESGLSFLQAGQANSFVENKTGLDIAQLNASYVARPDQGVIYDLNQGDTLELNPSIVKECQQTSCIIKIWWDNQGDPGAMSCDAQAGLLVSEYSQDAFDPNQFGGRDCNTLKAACNGNAQCLAFYESCLKDPSSIDPRTGLSRERARYYLFRPAVCAFDNVAGRDWAGYETALGNPTIYKDASKYNGISVKTGKVLGLETSDALFGTVVPVDGKQWQHFSANPNLSNEFSNYYEIPIWPNSTIVRIKALYANTSVLIDMKGQVLYGISSASDGNSQRTVGVKQTLPSVPGVMDYALFVGGGSIDKRSTITRD